MIKELASDSRSLLRRDRRDHVAAAGAGVSARADRNGSATTSYEEALSSQAHLGPLVSLEGIHFLYAEPRRPPSSTSSVAAGARRRGTPSPGTHAEEPQPVRTALAALTQPHDNSWFQSSPTFLESAKTLVAELESITRIIREFDGLEILKSRLAWISLDVWLDDLVRNWAETVLENGVMTSTVANPPIQATVGVGSGDRDGSSPSPSPRTLPVRENIQGSSSASGSSHQRLDPPSANQRSRRPIPTNLLALLRLAKLRVLLQKKRLLDAYTAAYRRAIVVVALAKELERGAAAEATPARALETWQMISQITLMAEEGLFPRFFSLFV